MKRSTDSRSLVIQRQRRRDKEGARVYRTSASRAAQLRDIRAKHWSHEQRVLKALQTGSLTAAEAAAFLDTLGPHARISTLRRRVHITEEWVKTHTADGRERCVKAYSMADRVDGV